LCPSNLVRFQMPNKPESSRILSRAWYRAIISDFLLADTDSVIGQLSLNSDFSVLQSQRDAWLAQIQLLQTSLNGLEGSLFIEFNIPRMGRRVDVVHLVGSVVFAVEFKVGESSFERSALNQVWDYALDLKNFH
jgi:hypothetical protein